MAKISDVIETFILSMLEQSENSIEIKRNELATYFGCVPSQINYVISTRFALDKGYIVESKQGGGGYIRITRMDADKAEYLNYLKNERIGSAITFRETNNIVSHLFESGVLTSGEKEIILSALKEMPMPMNGEYKDIMRAGIFKNIIVVILNREG